jgi:hypothetical protein
MQGNVKIYQRDFKTNIYDKPHNDGGGGDGDDGGNTDEDGNGGNDWQLFLVSPAFWLFLLGGIIVGVLVIAVLASRKKEKEQNRYQKSKRAPVKKSGSKSGSGGSWYKEAYKKTSFSGSRPKR